MSKIISKINFVRPLTKPELKSGEVDLLYDFDPFDGFVSVANTTTTYGDFRGSLKRDKFISRASTNRVAFAPKKPLTTAEETKLGDALGQIRELKNEIKQVKKNARKSMQPKKSMLNKFSGTYGNDLVSRAEDSVPLEFAVTGKSLYLKSVFAPDSGPAQIPDDVVQQCHIKGETVTYNLTVAPSGAGVLLLLPDHPGDLIGYHYTQNALGSYAFDKILKTAQNLPDNYDYGRRVSQLLTIKSSTIPSGVYALNGTFNAVRVEGTFSEIPTFGTADTSEEFYNGLMTNTVDVLDKVGNVLVGDGLAILSLMGTIDQPFTRLGDATPISSNVGTVLENSVLDLMQSLAYHTSFTTNDFTIGVTGTPVTNFDQTFNFDSTSGLILDASLRVEFPSYPNALTVSYTLNLIAYDPFGNGFFMPAGNDRTQQVTLSASQYAHTVNWHVSTTNYAGPPIASIHVLLIASSTGAITIPNTRAVLVVDCVSPGAAKIGQNKPVVIAAYQGVAAGSVLTVGGVTNFELIPNPVLRQNLALSNGYADDKELEYAKNLLHHRHKFGLKSVWKLTDYWANRPILEELADVKTHDKARALSGSDVVKFFKNRVLPNLLPFAMRVLTGGTTNEMLPAYQSRSVAASGVPIVSNAASGAPIVGRAANNIESYVSRAMESKPVTRKLFAKSKSGAVVPRKWRVTLFPTIITPQGSLVYKGGELFAVANVKPLNYDAQFATRTVDGHNIYGLNNAEIFPLKTGTDLWIFPVDPASIKNSVINIVPGHTVEGRSADAAIYLCAHGTFSGLCPVPITGSLELNGDINPVESFPEKSSWLAARSLPLAGNSSDAAPRVKNVKSVLGGISSM